MINWRLWNGQCVITMRRGRIEMRKPDLERDNRGGCNTIRKPTIPLVQLQKLPIALLKNKKMRMSRQENYSSLCLQCSCTGRQETISSSFSPSCLFTTRTQEANELWKILPGPGPFLNKRQAGASTWLKDYFCHNKDSQCFDGLFLIFYTLSPQNTVSHRSLS